MRLASGTGEGSPSFSVADSNDASSAAPADDTSPSRIRSAEEMMVGVRERQPWAARCIWDQYGHYVRRLLARGLGPSEDVNDLTQEVFLRVFSRVHTLRAIGALRDFVTSVAIHVLKWELRRRWVRRKVRLSPNGVVPDVESEEADPEARDALLRCYAILDRLGARERGAFVLRYMEEMKMEEVADALGVSLSTAKRLVNRSAKKVSALVAHDPGLRDFFEGTRNDGDAGRIEAPGAAGGWGPVPTGAPTACRPAPRISQRSSLRAPTMGS